MLIESIVSFGAGISGAGVGAWLGKLWLEKLLQAGQANLDRQVESHKASLRKSEFLFEKEFEATLGLNAILREIVPDPYHRDMDYEDACEAIASNLERIVGIIERFLDLHSASLLPQAVDLIGEASNAASWGKLQTGGDLGAAQTLWKNLESAEQVMRESLRGQVKGDS